MGPMASGEKRPILQAAVVPYRLRNGTAEFCLITSVRNGNWGVPKGIIDPGETPVQAALKEAREEAGLHGQIEGEPLGQYRYHKWGTSLTVTVYLMHVTQADSQWEEAALRDRIWCQATEARRLIHRSELRQLLGEALQRIPSQSPT